MTDAVNIESRPPDSATPVKTHLIPPLVCFSSTQRTTCASKKVSRPRLLAPDRKCGKPAGIHFWRIVQGQHPSNLATCFTFSASPNGSSVALECTSLVSISSLPLGHCYGQHCPRQSVPSVTKFNPFP